MNISPNLYAAKLNIFFISLHSSSEYKFIQIKIAVSPNGTSHKLSYSKSKLNHGYYLRSHCLINSIPPLFLVGTNFNVFFFQILFTGIEILLKVLKTELSWCCVGDLGRKGIGNERKRRVKERKKKKE